MFVLLDLCWLVVVPWCLRLVLCVDYCSCCVCRLFVVFCALVGVCWLLLCVVCCLFFCCFLVVVICCRFVVGWLLFLVVVCLVVVCFDCCCVLRV